MPASLASRVLALTNQGFDFPAIAAIFNVTPDEVQEAWEGGALTDPEEEEGGGGSDVDTLLPASCANFRIKIGTALAHPTTNELPLELIRVAGSDIALAGSHVALTAGTYIFHINLRVKVQHGTSVMWLSRESEDPIFGDDEDIFAATVDPVGENFPAGVMLVADDNRIWTLPEDGSLAFGCELEGTAEGEHEEVGSAFFDVVKIGV